MQSYLSKVKQGVSRLEREAAALRKQNAKLKADLDKLSEAENDPESSESSNSELVRKLNREVETLKWCVYISCAQDPDFALTCCLNSRREKRINESCEGSESFPS